MTKKANRCNRTRKASIQIFSTNHVRRSMLNVQIKKPAGFSPAGFTPFLQVLPTAMAIKRMIVSKPKSKPHHRCRRVHHRRSAHDRCRSDTHWSWRIHHGCRRVHSRSRIIRRRRIPVTHHRRRDSNGEPHTRVRRRSGCCHSHHCQS